MRTSTARSLYFVAQALRGEPVERVTAELRSSEAHTLTQLRELQWARQKAILEHAVATVPFYRDQFAGLGIRASDIRSPADWARLPVVEKRDLQESVLRMRSKAPDRGYAAATSGSTGSPVRVHRSHESWAHAHANIIRGWRWHGCDVGEPHVYFWGVPFDRRQRVLAHMRDLLFNRQRASAFALDSASARALYDRLVRRPVRLAVGYPSAFARFAVEVAAQGLDGRRLGWRVIVCNAEMLHDEDREVIAEVFDAKVVNSYGSAEVGVTGFECAHGGMHVPVESVVVEAVRTPHGDHELLLTDLFNRIQPIIRYRIGDLVECERSEPCSCGLAHPRLGRLLGRASDWIRIRGNRWLNPHVTTYLFKSHARHDVVRDYQLRQHEDETVGVWVVPGMGWSARRREKLTRDLRKVFGHEVKLHVTTEIPRVGRGKHRDVVRTSETVR